MSPSKMVIQFVSGRGGKRFPIKYELWVARADLEL